MTTAVSNTLYSGPAVTVTFEDHGQDFLEWDIRDGYVVGCRPFQADIWCGLQVHSTPGVGQKLAIINVLGDFSYIKYPLTKVRAMRIKQSKPPKLSKAILSSKVVTEGAMALLVKNNKVSP